MVYVKLDSSKKVIKAGSLYKLVLNCANPTFLSEVELKNLSIYKTIIEKQELKSYEYFGNSNYTYDEETDTVIETKEILSKTLDECKVLKINEIKNTLAQIISEGFTDSKNVKIDCEANNVNDWSNNMILLNESGATETYVTDYNNNGFLISYDDYKNMIIELGIYITKLRGNKQILRDLINDCTTCEEVEAIYWRKEIIDEESGEITGYEYNSVVEEQE